MLQCINKLIKKRIEKIEKSVRLIKNRESRIIGINKKEIIKIVDAKHEYGRHCC
jgi:hypothetical protein